MAPSKLKRALQRLEKDLQEFTETPEPNISASPLESNMLEWHCNICFNGNVYHLIMFFSEAYPAVSPKLEVMPPGFKMEGVVVKEGEKGTSLCLDIFSDFEDVHPEWQLDRERGWSPCYTIKFVLLNLLSYFHEVYREEEEDQALNQYLKMSESFVCSECGHSIQEPFPPFSKHEETPIECLESGIESVSQEEGKTTSVERERDNHDLLENKIVDYMSREKFCASSEDQLFGYGLVLNVYTKECTPTSPCEFLTASSFKSMCDSLGRGKSILREDLNFFLPLYITQKHSTCIEAQYHKTMTKIAKSFRFKFSLVNNRTHVIVNVFCHLLWSGMDRIYFHSRESIENVFDGYFQIHRLFLWAIEKDQKILLCVDNRLKSFLDNPKLESRKRFALDFDYFFTLLSVSCKYNWEDVADKYMREFWRRSVATCFRRDKSFLNVDMSIDERLQKTFTFTRTSRNCLAFQLAFLKMIRPPEISHESILRQYEDNFSFPSPRSVSELRTASNKIIHETESFDDWFKLMCLPVPSKKDLFISLRKSVEYATNAKGYLRL